MKTVTLPCLALCAGLPLAAQAPSSFTVTQGDTSLSIFGVLDAGVARVQHTLGFDEYHPVGVNPQATKAATDAAVGMFNGGISQTRIGLRGATKLDEDWKGVFTLESAINIPNGNVSNAALGLAQSTSGSNAAFFSADSAISGQLFNRNANLGVASERYGTLTLGRHTSLMLDLIPGYDALEGAQLFTPLGFSGAYGGGGATENSRVDDSAKYRLKAGDFSLGLLYKFSGAAGSSSARGAEQLNAGYERGAFGVQLAYQAFQDAFSAGNPAGTPASPLGTLAATAYDTKCWMLALRYKAGGFSVRGGFQRQAFTNPSHPALDAELTSLYGQVVSSVNVTPYTVGGHPEEKALNVCWIGTAYDATRRLNLAVGFYQADQSDFSQGIQPGGPNTSGKAKFESLLLDWRFTPAFDTYIGFMATQVSGGLSVYVAQVNGQATVLPFAADGNSTMGLGLRYQF